MKYLVTVICLTYNHEKYIEKTLNGFLKQKTTFPVEYIIRDDASTDNTANILHEYERKYPGYFNIIYEKENQYSKNIIPYFSQKVIMETKSKYVALCEGDDYWCDDNKLQKQVDLMEKNPSASFCVHANYELNDKTGKMKKRHPYKKSGVLSIEEVLIEPGGMPATCTMLMRTEYINQYPVYDLPCPVGDRSRRMFLIDKGPALYIDDLMCVYRVNNSNSFGGQLYNYNKSIKLVEEMNTFFDLYNNYTNFKYTSYIKLLKEREIISHYVRFKKYDQIVKTEFYKKYYTFIDKIKLFVKWRLSPLYVIYKKKNNI